MPRNKPLSKILIDQQQRLVAIQNELFTLEFNPAQLTKTLENDLVELNKQIEDLVSAHAKKTLELSNIEQTRQQLIDQKRQQLALVEQQLSLLKGN